MFKDQADHEWTTWKLSATQGRRNNKKLIFKKYFLFAVGAYVCLFSLFSWLTKRFLRDYSLILNVNILKYF